MANDYDFLILGGGGAGRLLVKAMYHKGFMDQYRIALLDKEIKTDDDRTWCFWAKDAEFPELEALISNTWERNVFNNDIYSLAPYKYAHLSSSSLYRDTALMTTYINCDVMRWQVFDDRVEVQTSVGLLTAQKVFNSIQNFSSCTLLQSFVGWRIVHDKSDFNSEAIKMMDFSIEQADTSQFMYVLPFSENVALVEVTRFSETPIAVSEAEVLLEQYLENANYSILSTESGVIPMCSSMDVVSKKHSKYERVIPIGISGGATKPTTGYTFVRMWKHAQQIVEALEDGGLIPTLYRKRRFRLYDRLLLDIIQREPAKAKQIFTILFTNVSHPLIFKFLNEETSILEEVIIFRTLPKMLFIKALIRDLL